MPPQTFGMPRVLDHLIDLFKKTDDIYHACTSGRAGTGDDWCKLLKNLVGCVGADPAARWLRVPPKTNLRATRQDERRPGSFFARYRMASLFELYQ